MAYEKQNFKVGQILTAAQMNHIEDGIEQVEKNVPGALPSPGAISFTNKSDGTVIVEYNGSEETIVEIPDETYINETAKGVVTWENIPDKPFGQIGYAGVVLDGNQVLLDSESGEGMISADFRIYEKVDYMVIWNGAYYQCKGVIFAMDGMNVVWLGNMAALGAEGGNNDAPFLIGRVPADVAAELGATGIVMALDGATEVQISVASLDTFVQVDEALIPNTIARVDQIESMIDSKLGAIENGAY